MLEKYEKDQELKSAIEQADLLAEQNQFEQANVLYNKALEIYNETKCYWKRIIKYLLIRSKDLS